LEIIQSIILGLIQGATEFLPVSSSGHLVIFPYFFGWDSPGLPFIVTVHFATLVSVVTVFYRDICKILKAVFLGIFTKAKRGSDDFKLGIFLLVASIPAAVIGFLLDDYFESLFAKPVAAGVFLLVTAFILWLGEFRGKRVEINNGQVVFNFTVAIVTGIGQALAIFPGVSRSGTTISFARFFGIKRDEAVRFSFLLSVPIIFGSFIFELYHSLGTIYGGGLQAWQNLTTGFVSAYVSGLFSVKFVVFLSKKRSLNMFAVYCICLALAVFIFYAINKIM